MAKKKMYVTGCYGYKQVLTEILTAMTLGGLLAGVSRFVVGCVLGR